jgi:hypothetical protein
LVRENTITIAANSEAIAELRGSVTELRGSVTDLRALSVDMREGQAMLMQMMVEERQARQEFRQVTNAALDRIDRTLEELRRDRN